MNTNSVTLEAIINKKEDSYILSLTIKNISDIPISFNFSNSSGGFARNCINIYDENKENYKYVGKEYISPISYDIEKINLKKGEKYIISLNGKLRKYDYGMSLEFKGKSFYVEKGKKYYLQVDYKGAISNMVELTID